MSELDEQIDGILYQLAKEIFDVQRVDDEHNMGTEWLAEQLLRAQGLIKRDIQALIANQVREARIDELQINRNKTGLDIGWIKMTNDDVDDRIAELQSTQPSNTEGDKRI